MTLKRSSLAASTSCEQCAVGRASGRNEGHFCPFINRERKVGELMYVQGEPADYVWYVKSGTVALYREAGDGAGEGRVSALRFPGQFVGLETIVSPSYWHSARTTTDVSLCGATQEGIDRWLGAAGTPSRTALEISLRTTGRDIATRGPTEGSALQRVARWLYDEGPRGVMITLPRTVLADLLRMRPETLSRTLAALGKTGAIQVRRNQLTIVDEQSLAHLAKAE